MSTNWETKKALIVVRTYPTPAKSGVEVSCTAAITDDGKWLRLFPVPWRYLPEDQRFGKFNWVEVTVTKASDPRPESYRLKPDGIKILSFVPAGKDWQTRKGIVLPLHSHCLCCLTKQRDANKYPTLGIFKPKSIERLLITKEPPSWTDSQLGILRQGHLFAQKPKRELEKVPFSFRYEFRCDHEECPGHKLMCTDWEMGEAWRQWSIKYGGTWEEKFRQRFEREMIEKFDTHFFVGTIHQHPGTWIIVGLFYPPRSAKGPGLFG
jgi:hypothetical protein